jgi:hypothetical protein
MREFREAVDARDMSKVMTLLAPDVEFLSPVSFEPYRGRELVGWILASVATVFEDFHYVDQLEMGSHSMLKFRARVGDRLAEGVDLIELNGDGQVKKLSVMVRPLSALQALGERMAARFAERKG